ncbi:hypothetical protein CLOM_g9813 [Closterium sp. NIES-68]|nr:hypothetical protein CLOM_g9813 [Closterium sp. NIES-68]GJP70334.1 hypothetical protein CLOP_g1279 [Closterium sp. NIES-67]
MAATSSICVLTNVYPGKPSFSLSLSCSTPTLRVPSANLAFTSPHSRRVTAVARAVSSTESGATGGSTSTTNASPPTIVMCFLSPDGDTATSAIEAATWAAAAAETPDAADSSAKVPATAQVVTIGSGEKNLRRAMADAKVPLYDMYGSVMNCGGGGSCGTCLVDIVAGAELLSGRTEAEGRYLKKRPESWRLACQTIVGDKENSGRLVIQRMPQKVKK